MVMAAESAHSKTQIWESSLQIFWKYVKIVNIIYLFVAGHDNVGCENGGKLQ